MLTNEGRAALAHLWELPPPVCFGDSPESFWVRQVRDLYIYTVDMEVDEFEALIAVVLTGRRPDDDRLPLTDHYLDWALEGPETAIGYPDLFPCGEGMDTKGELR